MFAVPDNLCVTFVSNLSDPFYSDLNKTGDLQTKLFPAIKFNGKYEVVLIDFILKNTYGILRKDCTYDANVRPDDLPVYGEIEEWLKSLNCYICPHLTLNAKNMVI